MTSSSNSPLLKQTLGARLPLLERARGVYLFDEQGKDYLDGSAGAMTVSIGHGVPEVLRAMAQQADAACFTFRTQFTSRAAEELAELLVALAPGDLNGVLFANSGSEATELAVRTAVQYWRERGQPDKTHVLGRRISYHGMTLGALSMSGHPVRRRDYGDLLHGFDVGPEIGDARMWEDAIRAQGARKVAALIVEPIIGAAGGVLTPPVGHLRELRRLCDEYGILLIADEVITGFGRTGAWFACEHDRIVPDMIAVGKGMTSGYTPMSALIVRQHIVETMARGSGGAPFTHTFSGNPLSAAVSLAVLRYMQDHDVLGNVAARSVQLSDGLAGLRERHSCFRNLRGCGLLWGFDLHRDAAGPAVNLTSDFVQDCFTERLIVYPAGTAPSYAAMISPPLTITEAETQDLLLRLDRAARRFLSRTAS